MTATNADLLAEVRRVKAERAALVPEPPLSTPAEPDAGAMEFLTVAELRSRVRARGPRKYVLRGLWPTGDYGILAAEPKAQKTWSACDMAVAVASGTPWLGLVEVDTPGPVLIFYGEGGEANLLRRLDAAAEARGLDLDELEIVVCTRAPQLGSVPDLLEIQEQLDHGPMRPVLVILDPLYLSARGAELGDVYKMGALLQRAQVLCQTRGIALLVVHHFNRQSGSGAARMSGAGPREWGRVLISVAVKSRRTEPDTMRTTVVTQLDIEGGEIPDRSIRVTRRVWADDLNDLDSPMHVETDAEHVTDDHGGNDQAERRPAARKLLEAMTALDRPATRSELVDWIAEKHGHGLTRETCSRELNGLATEGVIDGIEEGRDKRWFLRPVTGNDL